MSKIIAAIVFVCFNSASASKNSPIDTDARVRKSVDPFLSLVAAVSANFDPTVMPMDPLPHAMQRTGGEVPRAVFPGFHTRSAYVPKLWNGDGEINTYEVLSEELVFVSFMRRHGMSTAKTIYDEIVGLIPTTKWTLSTVQNRFKELLQSIFVPAWLHKICMDRFARGIPVDASLIRLISERMDPALSKKFDLALLEQKAHNWTNRCVRKMYDRENRVPPCIEVSFVTENLTIHGFALSEVEIMAYLKTLEFVEAVKLVIADDYAAIVDPQPVLAASGPIESKEVIPEPRILSISERNSLLPNAWTGDGEESQVGPWSEELVLLSHLRKHGPSPSTEIQDAIRARFPESTWSMGTINRRLQDFTQFIVVPGWFHDICLSNFERSGSVDSQMIQELAQRQSTIQYSDQLELIERLATHWIDNCIRDVVVPSCIEVRVEPGRHRAFALSGPQITRYLEDLELYEAVNLAFSQDSNPPSEGEDGVPRPSLKRPATDLEEPKPAKIVERHTARWHVLNRLKEQITTTDEELLELVNDSGFQLSIDDVRQIKAEILAPTSQPSALHDLMVSVSVGTESASQSFDIFNTYHPGILTERQFHVWYNYCIQPLSKMGKSNDTRSKKAIRPCLHDTKTGLYTLSRWVGLAAYLADELTQESSRL